MAVDPKRVASRWMEGADKKWNPWTAPLGDKRPEEPEKGSYEAYVARKKKEGKEPLSKKDWEQAKRHYKSPFRNP